MEHESEDNKGHTLFSVVEACEQLRISKWTLYRLMRENKLESVKIGSRRLIPASAISEYIGRIRGSWASNGRGLYGATKSKR
jgi:excisionase family DNA binding protein